MSNIYKKFTEAIKNLSLSFTRESLLAGFFFFLVLCSWYVLRPVRNEMAVQNSDILPYLLGIGALVMLVLNPVYSWLASRKNLRGVLIGCYSFFILNLIIPERVIINLLSVVSLKLIIFPKHPTL